MLAKRRNGGLLAGRLGDDVGRFIDDIFTGAAPFNTIGLLGGTAFPALNVWEDDEAVYAEAEVPGVDPAKLEVTVTGNVLTLRGNKEESTERRQKGMCYAERRFGSFERNIQLPDYVDPDNVSAEHANGVVTIRVAKQQSVAPRRIPVKAAGE